MRLEKKTVIRAALCLLALFVLLNICWFVWRAEKYGAYSEGMEKNYFSTRIVPRYKYTDADGYDYGVKYPDYLSLTGNLSVGLPTTEEDMFTDFLVIWPKFSGGYEYGVSVEADGVEHQIYINADGSAVHKEDSGVVDRCQENIDALLLRAREMWDLG